MIYKLEKMSIDNFWPNPRYWRCKVRIRQKIAIFDVKCHFSAFSHKWKNQFFVEYSTGIEISSEIFLPQKFAILADTPYKYLGPNSCKLKNYSKSRSYVFFSTSQYILLWRPRTAWLLWNEISHKKIVEKVANTCLTLVIFWVISRSYSMISSSFNFSCFRISKIWAPSSSWFS